MKRATRSLATAALLASSVCPLLLGHAKHAPLPEQILQSSAVPRRVLQAKTVYLTNEIPFHLLDSVAYDEIVKWGRFRIVRGSRDADIAIVTGLVHSVVVVLVMDPFNDEVLWCSVTEAKWSAPDLNPIRGAIHSQIDELRKQIEESEKQLP